MVLMRGKIRIQPQILADEHRLSLDNRAQIRDWGLPDSTCFP
jgi:hypothetical protein